MLSVAPRDDKNLVAEFTKTGEPLGLYIAGKLPWTHPRYVSEPKQQFQKRAEEGDSWAQVGYAECFEHLFDDDDGDFSDQQIYLEWREKAAR
jgi:hypothetical protein